MRKKRFTCPECYNGFTRFWNLQRHSEDLHNLTIPNPPGQKRVRPMEISQVFPSSNTLQESEQTDNNSFFKPMYDVLKLSNEYSKTYPPNLNNLIYEVKSLEEKLNSCQYEIQNIKSNCWIVPKNEIEGITAFYCKRCLTISFRFAIDIGFDKTAEGKHQCDENKVKQIFQVGCRPIDHQNTYNFVANELMRPLNVLIPGDKFLLATDISKMFSIVSSIDDYKTNHDSLFRIKQRYPLYVLPKDNSISWINRAIDNLDKKIIMTDDEIIDFLRRFNSTYAVIEICKEIHSRWILIKIIP